MERLIDETQRLLNNLISTFEVRTQRCPTTKNILKLRLNSVLSKISLFKEGNYNETINCLRILVYQEQDLGEEFQHLKQKFKILQFLILSVYEDLVIAENMINEIIFSLE
jgi:hypothetical protein